MVDPLRLRHLISLRMKLLDWLCTGELTPDDILESVPVLTSMELMYHLVYTSDYVAEANCKVGTEHEKVTYEVFHDQQGKVIDRKTKTHIPLLNGVTPNVPKMVTMR